MPFFGQVWLWSLAGFLVGALLCWALVARPARRRVIELEDSLAAARRRKPSYEDAAPAALLPGFDRNDDTGRRDEGYGSPYGERPKDPYGSPSDSGRFDLRDNGPYESNPYDSGRFDTRGSRVDESSDELVAPPELSPEPVEPPPVAPVESTRMLSTPPVLPHEPVAAPPEVDWFPVGERFDVSRLDTESEVSHGSDEQDDDRRDSLPGGHLADDRSEDTSANEQDDDESDHRGGTIFTQHTTPIPAELIRKIDEDGSLVDDLDDADDADQGDEIDPHRGHFADALTPDDEEDWATSRGAHSLDEPAEPMDSATRYLPAIAAAESAANGYAPATRQQPEPEPTMFTPAPEPAQEADSGYALPKRSEPEPEPAVFAPALPKRPERKPEVLAPPATAPREPEPSMFEPATPAEPTVFASSVSEQLDEPVAEEEPDPVIPDPSAERQQLGSLPKRVPKKPGDRFPFGVRTSTPAGPSTPSQSNSSAPSVPAQGGDADRSRSLFEPIRPAEETSAGQAAVPAPARPRRGVSATQTSVGGVDTFVPPGPFGPGSAMPLPGGNSPSGEYRVKASVTALRYCSPESPKFDRTVAEVWFRSVADAERVGFRPLA